ncbi:hypothetical protein F5876DRAFT_73458 [Lentinula aff. lateritia]|uniref:Uncharacterized protein n=1 Tax=Lentinula aff. lateritia TaxID=2804960 RepID=A0ACC1U9W0_9AGAR|nr:hypothetical protein F5876DRAFT_73458 [Lentinula aff. lateritia]
MVEDDIEPEALQAQIDLSMSVTNVLVSSWMKPSNKPKTLYNQTLETELKEYMRRPPRLGVGASIPESTSISSRETARLKGSLVGKGKKRAREEEGESSSKLSDDEGESRAGAIRKKTVSNPFTMPTPKKKKLTQVGGTVNVNSGSIVKPPDNAGGDIKNHTSLAQVIEPIPESDVAQDKEKQETGDCCPPILDRKQKDSTTVKILPASSNQTALGPPSSPVPKKPHSQRPKSSQSDATHTVLNLNGPVGDPGDSSESDEVGASPSKPKKKRKKRKKKKKAQIIGTGEVLTLEVSTPM